MHCSWKRYWLSVLVVMTGLLTGTLSTRAALDMYMKIDEIDGEASVADHRDEIEITSINWGVSTEVDNSGDVRRTGIPNFKIVKITKWYDKSSPLLALACARGDAFPRVQLTSRRQGASGETLPYLEIELTDVLVTSYQTSASRGDTAEEPVDSIALNFEEIKVTYKRYDEAGVQTESTGFTWNVATNTGG